MSKHNMKRNNGNEGDSRNQEHAPHQASVHRKLPRAVSKSTEAPETALIHGFTNLLPYSLSS